MKGAVVFVTPAYLGDATHQPHSQAAGREPWGASEGQGVPSMGPSENSIYGGGELGEKA